MGPNSPHTGRARTVHHDSPPPGTENGIVWKYMQELGMLRDSAAGPRRQPTGGWRSDRKILAPQAGFEPTILRLTANLEGYVVRAPAVKPLKKTGSRVRPCTPFRVVKTKSGYITGYNFEPDFRRLEPIDRTSEKCTVAEPHHSLLSPVFASITGRLGGRYLSPRSPDILSDVSEGL